MSTMVTIQWSFLICLLFEFACILCADAGDANEVSRNRFDFIVVGAGAAGCVIAARLAKETNKTVLLLEGGAWGTGQRDIGGTDYVASSFKTDPNTGKKSLGVPLTRYDVPTMSDSIRSAAGVLDNMWPINATGVFFAQAKVVGGNQATNGMAWFATQKSDFDLWNLPGYSSAEMWPYMKKVENATDTGYGNSPDRGNSGPIHINLSPSFQMEQTVFYDTVRRSGYEDGGDMNTGDLKAGIYQGQSSVKDGIRQSTSIAYLAPVLATRRNIEFRTSATVTHVLFDNKNNATGVQYIDKKGRTQKVYAELEVILAAGSLQTTKILYHSGIGPRSVLDAFNIPHRVVNDIIGQKIRNHQRLAMIYNDITGSNANFYGHQAASIQYAASGTGMLANRAFFFVHFNSSSHRTDPYPYPDLHASPNPFIPAGGGVSLSRSDAYAQQFVILVGLNYNLHENATLNLTSSDPLAPTHYVGNNFAIQEDLDRGIKGVQEVRRIMKNWPGRVEEISPGPAIDSDEKVGSWILERGQTTFCHYHGTHPMGTDPAAPCDIRMRLRGVQKLRLVGPAIIPGMVYPGMQMLAVVLGEKGTDLILQDHGL